MTSANYTYSIEHEQGRKVLCIVDQKDGKKTVTNDIENVLQKIAARENIDLKDYMIVYRDSYNFWDGWDYASADFVILRSKSWKGAVLLYVNMQLSSPSFNNQNTSNG